MERHRYRGAMTITRIAVAALAAATLSSAAVLAGCGSSDTAASGTTAAATSTTDTSQMVGGASKCDYATIQKAVVATGTDKEPNTLATKDSFKCADGWAYAFVNSGTGSSQYTGTLVFEAEGQFWIPKDRAKVCTSPGHDVPAAIYQDACNTN